MPIPTFLKPRILIAASAAFALSACFGVPEAMKNGGGKRTSASKPSRPQAVGTPSFTSAEAQQCAFDLKQAGVRLTQLPDEAHGDGCTSIDSVKLLDVGVPVSGLGAITCPLATTFAAWPQYAVRPGERHFVNRKSVVSEQRVSE